ncbi:hybrid sensor histidine kinase/response regulator [Pseudodesulfovibrio sp. zrk46]|uniref:hybrid sensor histidine kinase/response regulator n=1 Tax=Pseudodesulfovibrio sp. zrk46 TaxID=2725288 RepID=UPI001448C691|nr:hybrid sensor histidine kinase/response regulator [Pseudodesulfovibrio sp. zrk46]QJB56506.1 response regulator [Pseudodesulfovibrio sp. zrk46]
MRIPAKYGIIISFTGLVLVLAAFIIISSSVTSKRVLSDHAHTIMKNIASYTIDKAQGHLEPARKAARLTLGLSQHDIVNNRDTNSMLAYFYEQLYLYPQFSAIYFGSTNGEFFMASRYNKLEQGGFYTKAIRFHEGKRSVEQVFKSPEGHLIRRSFDPNDKYDPRQRPWYKKAKLNNALIWTSPYIFFTSRKPGITTANPVYDSLGNFIGVIGVDIEIDKLSTFISKLNVSKHGKTFIMSRDGDLIAYPDVEKISRTEDGQKARMTHITELDDPVAREAFLSLGLPQGHYSLDKPISTAFNMNGNRYIGMFAPFSDKEWPWLIGIYMPEDDYIGPIRQNGILNIFFALGAVMIALFFGLAVARKLNIAREMAEIADKAKTQFLARMSHEIRTPMNAILGAGELLSETKLSTEQRRLLSIYQSAGRHLRELVSSVLDISKIEEGKFRLDATSFSLHALITDTCKVFSIEAADKGLVLDCIIDSTTPGRVIGDPTALKQIIVNLLDNAIKFTDTGSIIVRTRILKRHTQPDGADILTVTLTVTDTGIGISEHKQKDIFERFIQADGSTSRMYGGSGLGLSISRNLAQLMGGSLTVHSTEGKGSKFILSAQVTVDPDNKAPAEPVEEPDEQKPHRQNSGRVLLVEDDERNRLLFSLFLKGTEYQLHMAESGEQALEMYRAAPYDLILMDIEMPGMDGFETTEAIRQYEQDNGLEAKPIVAVTAHAIKETEDRCKETGCNGYVTKPVTKERLREEVAAYLDQSSSEE